MEYYSRSVNSKFIKETLKKHALDVSAVASKNAAHFGATDAALIAGLLHDFGKCSDLFAQVLQGKAQGVNHAIPGVLVAFQLFYQKYKENALPVMASISGHHSSLESLDANFFKGLTQSHLLQTEMYDRQGKRVSLVGKEAYIKALEYFSDQEILPKVIMPKESYDYCTNRKIARMLFTRMLFSTLVDGDYCSAAAHFDDGLWDQFESSPLDFSDVLEKLLLYRKNLRQNSHSSKGINQIRDSLFESCMVAANNPRGLYTLTAPTGTGKTLSLMAFALKHARENGQRRIIIVLPFLSIIEQNAKIYQDIVGESLVLEDHSQSIFSESNRLYSDRWSLPVIITTSVKFFEVLFASKPTNLRRLHNITDSVIVFDEAQSLPPHLLSCTLDSVNALCKRYRSTVVFSTATQPTFEYLPNTIWNPREIVKNNTELYNKTRRVKVIWDTQKNVPLHHIADAMARQESVCTIVNLKRHAREIFDLLHERCTEKDSMFFISTDMCALHRSEVIATIKQRQENQQPCRLVSTSCIEAGVDLDFLYLYRALAPLESIIQAIGRCNRNGDTEAGMCTVFVPLDGKEIYPGDYYKEGANIVKGISSMHPIDIYNIEHIQEYYRLLFQNSERENKTLLEAIDQLDFISVAKEYKLIDKVGVNIIVPYNKTLYEQIKKLALDEGLDYRVMAMARPITVSAYDSDKLHELCEMVPFKAKKHKGYQNRSSNWYLLLSEKAYDKKKGLMLKENEINTAV